MLQSFVCFLTCIDLMCCTRISLIQNDFLHSIHFRSFSVLWTLFFCWSSDCWFTKFLQHSLQENLWFLRWAYLMCLCKSAFTEVEWSHISQWISLTFMCTDLTCLLRWCLCVKDFVHCGHLFILIILWTASSCFFKSVLVEKAYSQSVHTWSLFFRWTAFWCFFKLPFC